MKEVDTNKEPENNLSLYEQVMKQKPLFASTAEALRHYEIKFEELLKRTGRTYKEMFDQYEYSSQMDEDSDEAVQLQRTISRLRRLSNV